MKSLLIYALLFAICFGFIFAFDPKNRPISRKKRVVSENRIEIRLLLVQHSAIQGIFAPKNQIAVPKSTYKLKFLRQKLHKSPLFDVKSAHFSKSAFIRLQITIFSNSALDQSANTLQ